MKTNILILSCIPLILCANLYAAESLVCPSVTISASTNNLTNLPRFNSYCIKYTNKTAYGFTGPIVIGSPVSYSGYAYPPTNNKSTPMCFTVINGKVNVPTITVTPLTPTAITTKDGKYECQYSFSIADKIHPQTGNIYYKTP